MELIFITSNSEKLAHAKHLCRDYAIRISKQKNYGVGYIEPRIDNREELIKKSVEDAIQRFSKNSPNANNKFFFIEDTSVIINVLSKDKEVPGVDIKYWMRENNFSSLDSILKKHGNNRDVIVRSDVIIVLSKQLQDKLKVPYKIFTSQVKGTITSEEYKVKTQPLYPWLSQKTFNKWFVPEGCNKPLSLLDINEADKHDFRAGAFEQMLNFLHEHKIIETRFEYNKKKADQLKLFAPFLFIICGPTCAGKTTLATFLVDNYNYYHLEASDFMYLSYYERHGFNSDVSIGDFAAEALKENPAIVTDQILDNIGGLKLVPIVITGFRNPKEIENFLSKYKGSTFIKSIYVDSNAETRYQRSIIRDRKDGQKTFEEFSKKDLQQQNMGLPMIKEKHSEEILNNDKTLQEYYASFESLNTKQLEATKKDTARSVPKFVLSKKLQNAIISTLAKQNDLEKFHTTTEIAHLINANSDYSTVPKNKNNVSRYFNQYFHPYFDISINEGGHACYRLSQTGIAYSKFLNRR